MIADGKIPTPSDGPRSIGMSNSRKRSISASRVQYAIAKSPGRISHTHLLGGEPATSTTTVPASAFSGDMHQVAIRGDSISWDLLSTPPMSVKNVWKQHRTEL